MNEKSSALSLPRASSTRFWLRTSLEETRRAKSRKCSGSTRNTVNLRDHVATRRMIARHNPKDALLYCSPTTRRCRIAMR